MLLVHSSLCVVVGGGSPCVCVYELYLILYHFNFVALAVYRRNAIDTSFPTFIYLIPICRLIVCVCARCVHLLVVMHGRIITILHQLLNYTLETELAERCLSASTGKF